MAQPEQPQSPPPRRRGFELFSVAGIRITVDPSWFIIFFLVAWSAGGLFRLWLPELATPPLILLSGLAALLLFASVLLHELSHSLVARLKGLPVERITLFIFGGVSHLGREPDSPTDEVQIAGAGPLASFLIAGVCLVGWMGARAAEIAPLWALLGYLAMVNLALGIFNLIPAFPLDGGRVLRAFLWSSNHTFTQATVAASRVGRILAFTLMGLGVLMVLATGTLGGLWWVLIGLFLNQAAGASAERAVMKEALSGHPAREIMTTDVVTLDPDQPLNLAVEEAFLQHHFAAFPVVQDGQVRGLLHLRDVKAHPRERWPYLSVSRAMTPLDDACRARPDEDITNVLERMLATGRGRVVVVDAEDRLQGILTRRDVMDFLRVRTDLGSSSRP